MIYFTSDLHLNHDKEFIYVPRGFDSVWQMNDTIVSNWNDVVDAGDDVYILGDIMLGNNYEGLKLFHQFKGNIHIIWGNHDTDIRKEIFKDSYNVIDTSYADMLHYNKYHFFLTHYPSITTNFGEFDKPLTQRTLNLSGHTHSKEKFYNDFPFTYNVAVDAHNCIPVSILEVIGDMERKFEEVNG